MSYFLKKNESWKIRISQTQYVLLLLLGVSTILLSAAQVEAASFVTTTTRVTTIQTRKKRILIPRNNHRSNRNVGVIGRLQLQVDEDPAKNKKAVVLQPLKPVPVEVSNNSESGKDDDITISDDSFQFPTTIMCLCWGVTFLSSLDKVAMSVALLPLSNEFGYTETIKGQISSLFSLGYGLMIIPMGIVVSVASPRLVMGTGITLWSLGTLLTPTAAVAASASSTIVPLLGARAAVGAAESVVFPTIQRILSAWIPDNRRSTATAIILSGFQMGTVAAFLISPYVMDYNDGGWRGLFQIYGGIGLIWLIPWMLLAKDAPDSSLINVDAISEDLPQSPLSETSSQVSSSLQSTIETVQSAPIRDIVSSRGVQAILIAQAANNWGMYINVAWTPTFYAEQYGLNVKDSALLSVGPAIAGILCGVLAGTAADAWIQRATATLYTGTSDNEATSMNDSTAVERMTRIRKTFQGVGLYGSAICLAVLAHHIPEEPWVAQTLLVGTVGLQALNTGGYAPATQEKAGAKWSGLLYSLTSLPGILLGSLGVYTTGQILDLTGQDWSIVFTVNAIVNLIGATGFILLYNSEREFE